MRADTRPTPAQFNAYSLAFDYFNAELFGGQLPDCLLNFSRAATFRGFFAPSRWADRKGGKVVHEISLNPDLLRQPAEDIMGTLVHEMAHLWHEHFGKPSRCGYHNREWADKMEEIGLMPSSTGQPDGKRMGQRMDHYTITGGPYERAFAAMPPEYLLPWVSSAGEKKAKPKRRDKVAYRCPACGCRVWGKAGLSINCGACSAAYVEGI